MATFRALVALAAHEVVAACIQHRQVAFLHGCAAERVELEQAQCETHDRDLPSKMAAAM
jgi:hypothetical protein